MAASNEIYGSALPEPYGFCEYLRLNTSLLLEGNEETYNVIQACVDIYTGFKMYFRCWKFLKRSTNFIEEVALVGSVNVNDVIALVLMAIIWTIVRLGLNRFVFIPFVKKWQMPKVNAAKFPESAFKTLGYSVLWCSAAYVTFFRNPDLFSKTLSIWKDPLGLKPLDLRLVYGLEASHYVHSVYATIFMDKWRGDSGVMLLHHFVTLTLICFSYSVGYMKIGILIFVLNDFSDIWLELGKCFSYLKVRGDRFAPLWNKLSTTSASVFVVSWFFMRNVCHLTKVWRSASFGSFSNSQYLPPPMFLFFNILVGSLYLFYMYWFYFIVRFIIRILTGQMQETDDIRDVLDEEQLEKTKTFVTPDEVEVAQSPEKNKKFNFGRWSVLFSPSEKTRKTD